MKNLVYYPTINHKTCSHRTAFIFGLLIINNKLGKNPCMVLMQSNVSNQLCTLQV